MSDSEKIILGVILPDPSERLRNKLVFETDAAYYL